MAAPIPEGPWTLISQTNLEGYMQETGYNQGETSKGMQTFQKVKMVTSGTTFQAHYIDSKRVGTKYDTSKSYELVHPQDKRRWRISAKQQSANTLIGERQQTDGSESGSETYEWTDTTLTVTLRTNNVVATLKYSREGGAPPPAGAQPAQETPQAAPGPQVSRPPPSAVEPMEQIRGVWEMTSNSNLDGYLSAWKSELQKRVKDENDIPPDHGYSGNDLYQRVLILSTPSMVQVLHIVNEVLVVSPLMSKVYDTIKKRVFFGVIDGVMMQVQTTAKRTGSNSFIGVHYALNQNIGFISSGECQITWTDQSLTLSMSRIQPAAANTAQVQYKKVVGDWWDYVHPGEQNLQTTNAEEKKESTAAKPDDDKSSKKKSKEGTKKDDDKKGSKDKSKEGDKKEKGSKDKDKEKDKDDDDGDKKKKVKKKSVDASTKRSKVKRSR